MGKKNISGMFLILALAAALGASQRPAFSADTVVLTVGSPSEMTMPDVFDGHYKDIEIAGRKARVNLAKDDTVSLYQYFKVPDSFIKSESADMYVTIEYYDSPLQTFFWQYNGADSPYQRGPESGTAGTKGWVTSTFKLKGALLAHKQNGEADFRVDSREGLIISRVEVSWIPREIGSKPTLRERYAKSGRHGRRPVGMQYTFGNDASEDSALLYKLLGVTSVESYVTWETVESKGKGEWDWSKWDQQVDVLKSAELKWVPFLIVGPAYSTPDWFRSSDEHHPCVCLEHNTPSKIESLWNPDLPKYIDRFLAEFAKRYGDSGVLESVLLGIQGDFGEAIYSVFGGGWTFNVPGEYHNHPGFWCGDEYALKSFRAWAIAKYGSLDKLNETWGTNWKTSDAIDFPAKGEEAIRALRASLPKAPTTTKRHWLDFVEWYRGEMTRFADWWIATTKKHFPKTPIYLCTGGHAPPEHGADFGAQCKVAAKYGQGVRITNEASNYANNFVITRWVAAAGRFYGAFFGFEPAGGEDEKGIVARIYNATASGATQLHDYENNVTSTGSRQAVQQAHLKYLKKSTPIVDVALWYPNVAMALKESNYLNLAGEFRDITDYDYLDEGMLRDGALDRYKILVILDGDVMERSDMEVIEKWVRKGGLVLIQDFGGIKTVEGDGEPYSRLFNANGGARLLDKGRTVLVPKTAGQADDLATTLAGLMKAAGIVNPDLERDGVFATQLKGGTVMFLNTNATDVRKTIALPGGKQKKITAKANTITEIKIGR
jgi:hypothetical protein